MKNLPVGEVAQPLEVLKERQWEGVAHPEKVLSWHFDNK